MIVYIRMYIAVRIINLIKQAYIKENRILYEAFIEDDLEMWCMREVEAVDNECDHIQILAVVNAFNIGVIIENLNVYNVDTMKFPEEMKNIFIHMLFRPGHYDILY